MNTTNHKYITPNAHYISPLCTYMQIYGTGKKRDGAYVVMLCCTSSLMPFAFGEYHVEHLTMFAGFHTKKLWFNNLWSDCWSTKAGGIRFSEATWLFLHLNQYGWWLRPYLYLVRKHIWTRYAFKQIRTKQSRGITHCHQGIYCQNHDYFSHNAWLCIMAWNNK